MVCSHPIKINLPYYMLSPKLHSVIFSKALANIFYYPHSPIPIIFYLEIFKKLLVPHADNLGSKQNLEITHTWGLERQNSQKNQKGHIYEVQGDLGS